MVLCRLLYWFFALRHCTSTPNAGDLFSSTQQLLGTLSSSAARCTAPRCPLPALPAVLGLAAPLPGHRPRHSLRERQDRLPTPPAPRGTLGQQPPPRPPSLPRQILLCAAIAALHHTKPRGAPAAPRGKTGTAESAFENPPNTRPKRNLLLVLRWELESGTGASAPVSPRAQRSGATLTPKSG